MPLIDTNHGRAALLVLLLGVALVIALTPYATGLIGIPVLYAVFTPVHDWLSLRVRPKVAATLVVALALFLIVVPGVSFAGLIVAQAQEIAGGVIRNPLLGRLRELKLGGMDLGPRLADLGAQVVAWIGSSAFGLVSTARRGRRSARTSPFPPRTPRSCASDFATSRPPRSSARVSPRQFRASSWALASGSRVSRTPCSGVWSPWCSPSCPSSAAPWCGDRAHS